jgi:hypothetical protein
VTKKNREGLQGGFGNKGYPSNRLWVEGSLLEVFIYKGKKIIKAQGG